jgi:acetyl coenzyme A synthetase (ADP forming)-like protein
MSSMEAGCAGRNYRHRWVAATGHWSPVTPPFLVASLLAARQHAVAMTMDARSFATDRVLRDGGSIHVRAIRPDDKPLLLDHFNRLSARSVYFRFFRVKKRLGDDELRQFTELDFDRNVGLVATLRRDGEEEIIGVGRYARLDGLPAAPACPAPVDTAPDTPVEGRRAEVAFAVADAYQGRGVASVLLEHLAEIARAAGIEEFEADVLGENNSMLAVFASSGYAVKRALEAGVFHVTFPTEETPQSLAAEHQRDRTAAAASVRVFLQPGAVAVVGASERPGSIGAALIDNVRRCGFTGAIYPVHPRAATIAGLRAYPSVGAIGAPVDLAVVAVPAAQVEAVVADCARAGVRGVVVISAGFAEVAGEGPARQERLTRLVRTSGMRMVGPNCMGVLNTDPAVSLNATFAPQWPAPGNVAMLSQSGALGLAILDRFERLGLGLANFVSVGNKADVSGNDLLAYWADDPRTAVILLYLESFGNPRKFARVAPEVARRKPIVAVKSGRSAAGTRAASSHSAALANLDVAVDALFEQAGVIRTETLEQLFDVAGLLSTQPVPRGSAVGVVTNAGGLGILLADACEANGLTLPELAEPTRAALRGVLSPQAGLANPVDMTATASAAEYTRAIELVGADAAVDAVVVIYITPLVTHPEEIAAAIASGAGVVPAEKPVAAVFMSGEHVPPALHGGARGRLPAFEFPENAARALAAAARYARWRQRPAGNALELDGFAAAAIRAVVDRLLAAARAPLWVPATDVATILRAAGIEHVVGEEATPVNAVATAERLGYPLVAKAVAPGLVHKSDVGGVILDLRSADDVEAAVAQLRQRVPQLQSVLLQRQVDGVIEALVGVTTDPTFGPLVVCGIGGILVELLRDAAYRLPPVTDVDAAEMLGALRLAKLLDGYRGSPAGDRTALADVIRRVSALVELVPELRELDLNPVKVLAPGRGAVVVDARIRIGR